MQEEEELFTTMTRKDVRISYTGPFDSQVLSVIAKNIEASLSLNPVLNKKIFKIFIELAQNISYYSAEQKKAKDGSIAGIGTMTIQELDNHFVFATGNMTDTEKIKPVIAKCEAINKLDRKELRSLKREYRKLPPSSKGGGNIGLIQVALTAESLIDFQLIPVEENLAFYVVAVKVPKSINQN